MHEVCCVTRCLGDVQGVVVSWCDQASVHARSVMCDQVPG